MEIIDKTIIDAENLEISAAPLHKSPEHKQDVFSALLFQLLTLHPS